MLRLSRCRSNAASLMSTQGVRINISTWWHQHEANGSTSRGSDEESGMALADRRRCLVGEEPADDAYAAAEPFCSTREAYLPACTVWRIGVCVPLGSIRYEMFLSLLIAST